MYIPEYLTIEHTIDGVIVISNPYSFVYGIGITIEAAMNEYQSKQDVYIEQQLQNAARMEQTRLLNVRPEVTVMLEHSIAEIWGKIDD